MLYRWLADIVLLIHAAFVAFVVVGGLLVIRWRWLANLHLPVVVWGALIEFIGWVCPLTPLENWLRGRAGQAGYTGGFVEHYVLRSLYPGDIPPAVRWALGVFVVVINGLVYAYIWKRRRRTSPTS